MRQVTEGDFVALAVPGGAALMEPMFRARIVAGNDSVERVWPLTPYEVEIIIEDALRAGREARLELHMPGRGVDQSVLVDAQRRFARLAARGVRIEMLEETDLH